MSYPCYTCGGPLVASCAHFLNLVPRNQRNDNEYTQQLMQWFLLPATNDKLLPSTVIAPLHKIGWHYDSLVLILEVEVLKRLHRTCSLECRIAREVILINYIYF